jgi:hypothetical protein
MAATSSYASRTTTQAEHHHSRKSFHKPQTSFGATGHWIRTAVLLAPLVIGEFVHDAAQYKRAIRLTTIGGTLLNEGMWTNKIRKERQETREFESLACLQM